MISRAWFLRPILCSWLKEVFCFGGCFFPKMKTMYLCLLIWSDIQLIWAFIQIKHKWLLWSPEKMKESQQSVVHTLVFILKILKSWGKKLAFWYPPQYFFPHFSGKLCQTHVEAAVVLQAAGGPGTLQC